jgi:hypothetical protein
VCLSITHGLLERRSNDYLRRIFDTLIVTPFLLILSHHHQNMPSTIPKASARNPSNLLAKWPNLNEFTLEEKKVQTLLVTIYKCLKCAFNF